MRSRPEAGKSRRTLSDPARRPACLAGSCERRDAGGARADAGRRRCERVLGSRGALRIGALALRALPDHQRRSGRAHRGRDRPRGGDPRAAPPRSSTTADAASRWTLSPDRLRLDIGTSAIDFTRRPRAATRSPRIAWRSTWSFPLADGPFGWASPREARPAGQHIRVLAFAQPISGTIRLSARPLKRSQVRGHVSALSHTVSHGRTRPSRCSVASSSTPSSAQRPRVTC